MRKNKRSKACLPFLIPSVRLFNLTQFDISVILDYCVLDRLPSDLKWILNGLFNLQFNISDLLWSGKHSPWCQRRFWLSCMRAFLLYNNQNKGEVVFCSKQLEYICTYTYIYIYCNSMTIRHTGL